MKVEMYAIGAAQLVDGQGSLHEVEHLREVIDNKNLKCHELKSRPTSNVMGW